jgi:dephospho-CoA kinase
VAQRSAELLAAAPADSVVVYDVPLLAETMRTTRADGHSFDAVVVVTAPRDVRVARLVQRGLTAADAEARIDAQASDQERLALADHVVDNSGTLDELEAAVDAVWDQLASR